MKLFVAGAAVFAGLGAGASLAGEPGGGLARGERAFQKCYSCHALEPGRNDLSGPNLYAILGRRIAGEEDFDYSEALRGFAQREPLWTAALLDRYIADPEALVPGTDMTFTGIRDPGERADLILYLSRATHSEDGGAGGGGR